MAYSFDTKRAVRILLNQAKTLKQNAERALNDTYSPAKSKYIGFKMFAETFNTIARETEQILGLPMKSFSEFSTQQMGSYYETHWETQKQIVEAVVLKTGLLLTYLEDATDYVEDEFENISNYLFGSLRSTMFSIPDKETAVQDNIERLLIGRGLAKGIDYDRESGKFEFSGKEYIPDFILPKLNLCVEVKLLKEGRRSRIIDEINADITAYSTKYERLLFVVYDLGFIRDENEFRRDIENAGENIKVLIIKH